MKNSLLLVLAVLVIAFVAITIRKGSNRETSGDDSTHAGIKKAQISTFWKAYHRATNLRTQREFAQSAAFYERALEIYPDHEESLYYLGNCLFELGEYAEATKVYRRLTELNPYSQRGFSQLGVALSILSPRLSLQYEQAAKAFERNAEINPEESGPFLRLGVLALNQGRLEEAFYQLETAAGFRSPEGYFLAGYVRFRQRRYGQAANLFQRVLEMDAREKEISGRGVLSEGDTQSDSSQHTKTPLEAAAAKSLAYLFWTAARMGGYPDAVRTNFRIEGLEQVGTQMVDRTPASLKKGDLGRGAWVDYDHDGDLDLAVVTNPDSLVFYRNQQGRLVDVTASVGLAKTAGAWDLSWGDYDGDGWQDLYAVSPGWIGQGNNVLYRNDGDWSPLKTGTFTDVTTQVGLAGVRSTARAFFFDYNRDARPDLLEVGNAGPGQPSLRLFRSEAGRFRECSKEAGIDFEGNSVDCAIGDYDRDGFIDLAVLRWRRPAILYRNNRDGTFTDVTASAGLSRLGGDGFSILFFDYNRDDRLDLLVTSHAPYEMALESVIRPDAVSERHTPRLFRNEGDGSFKEVSSEVGLNRCYGVMQAADTDVDGDAWPDLIFANGGLEAQRLEPSLVLRNVKGKQFSPYVYIPARSNPSNSLGAAPADFDGDGKMDFYLSRTGLYSLR
ncbi:MAG: FG-GAP-like repeat-containing protein [Acidobacteriota bacterium]